MAETAIQHNGTVLNGTLQNIVTLPTGLVPGGGVIQAFNCVNKSGTARTVEIYVIPVGQTQTPQYLRVMMEVPASPYGTVQAPVGPFFVDGETYIQARQLTGDNDIILTVSGFVRTP